MTSAISVEDVVTDCEIIFRKIESLRSLLQSDNDIPSAVEEHLWRAGSSVGHALIALRPKTPV